MSKTKGEEVKELRGDKLRDLILLVHLNNKYGKRINEVESLREFVGYNSPGGVYSALNSSGYFNRTVEGIELTEKGKRYLNREILTPFTISNYVGIALMATGGVSLPQWLLWNYYHYALVSLEGALVAIVGGFIIRFFMLRIVYWFIRKTRRVDL